MIKKIKTNSADKFKDKDGYYIFPFDVLDKRTDGASLGRIQIQIEPIMSKKTKSRYYIEKLLICFRQTRDERYKGKLFEIPCWSEMILGDAIGRESYMNYVWKVFLCEIHKTFVFDAYPANNHKALKIDIDSSVAISIDFIKGQS